MASPGERFERVVTAAGRRPVRVLAIVALLAAVGAVLALRLEPSAATETLVDSDTATFQATERARERFGDHAIVVLVKGDLPRIVDTPSLRKLIGLERCLSGAGEAASAPGGAGSPCGRLAATKPVKVVYGPGTFIDTSVRELRTQLGARLQAAQAQAQRDGEQARRAARRQGQSKAQQDAAARAAQEAAQNAVLRELVTYSVRYGLGTKLPSVDDPDFVSNLVFDPARGADVPKARFAYLFPTNRSAVIQVRLKPDLSESERTEAIDLVREAIRMDEWRPEAEIAYTVTGVPVLAEDLTDSLARSVVGLLLVGLVVMAIALGLVFRSRLRLLPLGIALAAVAIVFGLMSLIGASLTMASIAVLPVLLGLGVDYAIQYQARVEEAEASAGTREAARRATRLAVPTIATAGLATVVGFLVLLLSPVPMVRGFGVLLVVGIVVAFVVALTAGTAALIALRPGRSRAGRLASSARGARELLETGVRAAYRGLAAPGPGGGRKRLVRTVALVALAAAAGLALGWWGTAVLLVAAAAGAWLAETGRAARIGAAALRSALERPARVLVAGLVLACAGWVVDSQTKVISDLNRLVPQDLPALRDLNDLQDATDVAGEVDVVVESADLTDPKVVAWMRDYQGDLLKRYGYSAARGCGEADLCPALSLPDLFRNPQTTQSQEDVRALLDAVPGYFSQAVVTEDRRTAVLAFGIKLLPLERQQEIIEDMRRRLAVGRPPGVQAELAGLPVLAAEANAQLSSPVRRLGTLAAGLLAVLLVLRLVYRRWDYALIPLVPIALATGWSALVLFALQVPLNPLSATLGALVIAISTEFAVLLSARFREERRRGYSAPESLRRTYRSTGAAVLASGVTAIAGFAVLAFSDVQMLKDFGRVTVIDLTVSLLGVLAVLPAVLMLAERRAERRRPPRRPVAPPPAPPAPPVRERVTAG